MNLKKIFFLGIFFISMSDFLYGLSLKEQFEQIGYVELCDMNNGTVTFDALYKCFDTFIECLHKHVGLERKLYEAKERFIRSKERDYYSTDFFGFYDESLIKSRKQISFYYSVHFHEYIASVYPNLFQVPEIAEFLKACCNVQKSYETIFEDAAGQLGLKTLFSSMYGKPPILFKVIKYLPSYSASIPHYDGTAFTIFVDSTDSDSLFIAPYKSFYTIEDFYAPVRKNTRSSYQNSILLIPGTFLREFSIFPTPHIVVGSGKTRYAAIAFAMRPHFKGGKNDFSVFPSFKKH